VNTIRAWLGRYRVALVIALAVLLAIVSFRIVNGLTEYRLVVPLDSADGLYPGSDVLIAGAKAGSVQDISLDGNQTLVTIALDDGAPVNFCKPAVDPLFTSAIDVWQGGVLALLLTGMGSDGTRGGKEIVAAGGSVVAQDEASSVVWGMPGAAAHAGICAAVLPLDQIAAKLVRLFSGDRS